MRQLKITKQITSRESLSFNKYLSEVSKVSDTITIEKEVELAKRIKNGDEQALQELIKANLRFVISVAKQYHGKGDTLEDLVNEGNIGLIMAAKRFDHSKGFKFISYAVWWVRQAITSYLNENARGIRMPGNKLSMISKIKKSAIRLEQQLDRDATIEEISEELKYEIDSETIAQMISYDQRLSSIDMQLGPDSNDRLSDLLEEKSIKSVDYEVNKEDAKGRIEVLLSTSLTAREREVIVLSFGLGGQCTNSLEEIGQKVGLTRERIRQIKDKSIRKLKGRLKDNYALAEYLNVL